MLPKENKHRPGVKVMGTSLNYSLHPSSHVPTFTRDASGRRIMPLAQLNTFTGRTLAEQQRIKCPAYTGDIVQDRRQRMNGLAMHPVSVVNRERDVVTTTSRYDCNDRDHLPSQMIDGESLFSRTDSPTTLAISRLVPLCNTCISIPGYLINECLQFLPGCIVCGYMSAEVLDQLASKDGELSALTDDSGNPRNGASKELHDWCLYKAKGLKKIHPHDSHVSLGDTLSSRSSSGTLKRSGAVRRTPTSSSTSSIESNRSKDLTVIEGIPKQCETLSKQFKFDPAPATTAHSQFYRLPVEYISSGSSLGDPFFLESALEPWSEQNHYSRIDTKLFLPPSAERPNAVKRTFSQILGHASRPTTLQRSAGDHHLLPPLRTNGPSSSSYLDGEINKEEVNLTVAT